jgi:hypothetical protein
LITGGVIRWGCFASCWTCVDEHAVTMTASVAPSATHRDTLKRGAQAAKNASSLFIIRPAPFFAAGARQALSRLSKRLLPTCPRGALSHASPDSVPPKLRSTSRRAMVQRTHQRTATAAAATAHNGVQAEAKA